MTIRESTYTLRDIVLLTLPWKKLIAQILRC